MIISIIKFITGGGEVYGSRLYTILFAAGETNVSISIPVTDDDILEDNENFMVAIDPSSLPTNVTVGDPGEATVIIVDDDCE